MNTLFREERILRILNDLKGCMYHDPYPLTDIRFLEGRFDSPEEAALAMSEAASAIAEVPPLPEQSLPNGGHGNDGCLTANCESGNLWGGNLWGGNLWGGRNSYAWFSVHATLPDRYRRESLLLRLSTAKCEEADAAMLASFVSEPPKRWDLMNPQFMLFVNGSLYQGMDKNHTEAFLAESAYESGSLTLDFQGYTGLTDSFFSFIPELLIVDEAVKELYYDMLTVFEAALTMSGESTERYYLLNALNEAVNCLDMRLAGTDAFHSGVRDAAALLRSHAYIDDNASSPASDISITCVGHTHIDMAWLWDIAQTRLKAQRSFSTVLTLMERYPDYLFMHSSPQLYAYIKKDNPELYRKIKARIDDGRWEPEGAMWIEADCNIPCGEALVRQILYGKAFIREEFGKDSKVLWMPDVFGYSAALPQILKKTGITCFVTSKISWNMLNTMPYDTFLWKGIDGGEILTYFLTTPELGDASGNCGATYNAVLHPQTVYGTWKQYKQKEINHDVLMCYGYGDGGGGPTIDMLEKLSRLKKGVRGFPKVNSGHIQPFFDTLAASLKDKKYLPKWTGELYLELHQGTYTSCGEIKWNNRRAEQLLLTAEWMESIRSLLGGSFRTDILSESWQTLLLNQFHDILPGSCIKEVYDDSRKQFASLFTTLNDRIIGAMKEIADRIHTKEEGILLMNPSAFSGENISLIPAPIIQSLGLGMSAGLADTEGRPLLSQPLDDGSMLVRSGGVPAFGYTALYRCGRTASMEEPPYPISSRHMENRYYSLAFDENGEICSLFDKVNSRQILKSGRTGNRLIAFDDRPYKWDSWNIDMYYEERAYPLLELESSAVVERGPLRYGLRLRRRYNKSVITQTIYLYCDSPRIDFRTEADWREDSTVLKAEFPTDINSDYASYDIQFGNVRRPTHQNTSWDTAKYEVCAHKWADLSEGGYGVSLLNDCKYGYSIQESTMRITLLKAGMAPDPTLDRGIHHFTYSLLPHSGSCYEGDTIPEAFRLNHPPLALPLSAHAGVLPDRHAFLTCPDKNIIIETFKRSEDGEAYILRLYETCNTTTHTRIRFALPFTKAEECDLLENPIKEPIAESADTLAFTIKPFEIKTFKLYK